MDHRDFGYTKKKKTAHRCACMHACKATRETGPKRANERSSERASERSLCDVCKFGLEQECGEDAAVRARVWTILSFCRLVRSERYLRTALHRFHEMLLFAAPFSTFRSVPASFHEFATIQEAKQSKEKKRKEIQQFPRQQFLSSKLSFLDSSLEFFH
jgi:hypothetical protein